MKTGKRPSIFPPDHREAINWRRKGYVMFNNMAMKEDALRFLALLARDIELF